VPSQFLENGVSVKQANLYFLIQLVAYRLKKSADNRLIESANMITAQSAAMTLIVASQPVSQLISVISQRL